ncbi:hypothetical protein [Flavobacterium sp. YJ01]|uniref:hypothetical protein n=1 Tax=unclassified Flavobacterium TaxID=196869 RepID=UPI0023E473AE|nr:hypothetical protein [Flavobacterium sp. YJ01]WET03849.1 hypothetical protein P0R33_05800 [Flavobacterium sp. YJ01]
MENLEDIIKELSIPDTRSSFYYLGRYLKQAEYFADYEKDIFVDEEESAPNEIVKSTTLKMINFIEKEANKKASEFTDEEYIYWTDIINEIEGNLDPIPNENLIKKAIDEIGNFNSPLKKTE